MYFHMFRNIGEEEFASPVKYYKYCTLNSLDTFAYYIRILCISASMNI